MQQREFKTLNAARKSNIPSSDVNSGHELLRARSPAKADAGSRRNCVIAKLTWLRNCRQGALRPMPITTATQLARRGGLYSGRRGGSTHQRRPSLNRILNLDPSIRLHPTDAFVVPSARA